MSLRPRYSLLTLLVLTALIAGGVKLWYGPHHVVEEREPGKQLEYTYTNAWNGEKIVTGPCIIRMAEPAGKNLFIAVTYLMKNEKPSFVYVLNKQEIDTSHVHRMLPDSEFEKLKEMPISASEQFAFRQAIDRERERIDQNPGPGMMWSEEFLNVQETSLREFRDCETFYEQLLKNFW